MTESATMDVDTPFQADTRTIVALILTVVIGAVATAAGVGGGAIYIPIFNALVGFGLKPSTALSQACITAGSLAALAANLPRTSPLNREEPLVDFPLMVMLTPILLVGVGLGVLLNVMLPSWLLNILLLLLLLLLLVQAVAKGRSLWQAETKRNKAALEAEKAEAEAAAAAAATAPGSETELLPRDALASHLTAPSLRQRQRSGLPYNAKDPRSLDPEEEASFGCLEGMDAAVAGPNAAPRGALAPAGEPLTPGGLVHASSVPLRPHAPRPPAAAAAAASWSHGGDQRGRRRGGGGLSYADASLDCMEGVMDPAAVIYEEDDEYDEEGLVSEVAAARGRGAGGATGSPRPPVARGRHGGSGLVSAPSWRAFNELGLPDFDSSGNEATDNEGQGGRHRSGSVARGGFPASVRSPFSMRPFARAGSPFGGGGLLSSLRPSHGDGPRPGVGPPIGRRASYDPAALAALAAAGGPGGSGAEGDSWLQRRSKWRSRFPPAALPHRSQQRLAPASAVMSLSPAQRDSLLSSAGVPPSPSARPRSVSRSGSGLAWVQGLQGRSSRASSGAGVFGAGTGIDQPLLGSGHDFELHDPPSPPSATATAPTGTAPSPDPRLGYSSDRQPLPAVHGAQADTGAGAALDGTGGGGGGSEASPDPYRHPRHLETLMEEADDVAAAVPAEATAAVVAALMLQRSPFAVVPSGQLASTGSPAGQYDMVNSAAAAGALAGGMQGFDVTDVVEPATPQQRNKNIGSRISQAERSTTTPDLPSTPQPGPRPTATIVHTPFEVEDPHAADLEDGGLYDSPYGLRDWLYDAAAAAAAGVEAWAARWAAAFRRIPRSYALVLMAAWVTYLVLQGVKALQPQCSPAWWTLFVLQIAAMMAVSLAAVWFAGAALRSQMAAAVAADAVEEGHAPAVSVVLNTASARGTYQPPTLPPSPPRTDGGAGQGDAQQPAAAAAPPPAAAAVGSMYDTESASLQVLRAPVKTLTAAFCAGLTGGLLGLGGGMVMGPLLLQIGVHPQITAATSGAMVLFSSSSALAQFALLHRLNLQYAFVFGAGSLVAGMVGTNAVAKAVKRSGRPSIVVLALAGVMAVGTLVVAVFGMRSAAAALKAGEMGFQGLCDAGGAK